jgi:hypothetical protein
MKQLTEAELAMFEQAGGRADPQLIPGSKDFSGYRITNSFGDVPGAMDTVSDLGGVAPQVGGRRRQRRQTRRNRSAKRNRRSGRFLLNLRLRVSSRQRHRS